MNNKYTSKTTVEEEFLKSGINKRLWFTCYGYYQLYGEARFLWATIFSFSFFITLSITIFELLKPVTLGLPFQSESITLKLFLSAIFKAFSDALIGDIATAIKWVMLGFIVFNIHYWF